MVRQMKAKPKPTTRSLFCQLELDEELEEFQSSDFDAVSSQAVQNVMQEVLLFSELSSREQLAHIEMDGSPCRDRRFFLFPRRCSIFSIGSGLFVNPNGKVELLASSSSASSASTTNDDDASSQ